jgi:hypothetical protein
MSQNLSDSLISDLNTLRDKYADLFMETSQFVGCIEIFKIELIMQKEEGDDGL